MWLILFLTQVSIFATIQSKALGRDSHLEIAHLSKEMQFDTDPQPGPCAVGCDGRQKRDLMILTDSLHVTM